MTYHLVPWQVTHLMQDFGETQTQLVGFFNIGFILCILDRLFYCMFRLATNKYQGSTLFAFLWGESTRHWWIHSTKGHWPYYPNLMLLQIPSQRYVSLNSITHFFGSNVSVTRIRAAIGYKNTCTKIYEGLPSMMQYCVGTLCQNWF